jgi:hypothetical protein
MNKGAPLRGLKSVPSGLEAFKGLASSEAVFKAEGRSIIEALITYRSDKSLKLSGNQQPARGMPYEAS